MKKDRLLQEISWFMMPLFEATVDEEHLTEFFRKFGYVLKQEDKEDAFRGVKALTDVVSMFLERAHEDSETSILEGLEKISSALNTLSENATLKEYFGSNFFNEVLDSLLISYLSISQVLTGSTLLALGVIEEEEVKITNLLGRHIEYTKTSLHWKKIATLFNSTDQWAKDIYNWNSTEAIKYERLFKVLSLVMECTGLSLTKQKDLSGTELAQWLKNSEGLSLLSVKLPFFQDDFDKVEDDDLKFLHEAGLKIMPFGDFADPKNLGFALAPYAHGNVSDLKQLSEFLSLKITGTGAITDGEYITVTPKEVANKSGTKTNGKFEFEFKYANPEDKKNIQLISFSDTSKLESKAIRFLVGGNMNGEIYLGLTFDKLKASIDLSKDGFLSNFFDKPIEVTIGDVAMKWQHKKGLYFEGGNNVSVKFPLHLDLNAVNIREAGTELILKDEPKLIIELTGALNLGPVQANVEDFGIYAAILPKKGVLAKYDLDFGLKAPKSIGLSINTGAVTGAGFLSLDPEKEEYAGIIDISISGFISAKAIGVITTKLPDGTKGFSMVMMVTAEFDPAFQLGFGFTLVGVGGLLGLNRTALVEPLRKSVRTGAVNNLLFPKNVISNASRIISDLNEVFPSHEDRFLIGPMAKIGWGTPTLMSLSFGLIIEIPGNISILGLMKIVLPDERFPLLKLQVAFLGIIDFDKKTISFDASLFDSSILNMVLEGDMAARMKWGDDPNFLVSIGGFHPSYSPPPLNLPSLRRLSISILNTSIAKIRMECYQAVTSNTIQFGAKAEVLFDLKACSISGHIGFDALFQFSPFYFIIDLSANFSLKALGISMMSVRIKMSLEGPTPWRARGTGKVSLLFFDISANFDTTWGEKKNTSLPTIEILPRLLNELKKKEQWVALLPSKKDSLITLNTGKGEGLVLQPGGELVISQKILPFLLEFEKIGNQKTSDIKQASIIKASSGGQTLKLVDVKDHFARAQFFELSNADRLSYPSFEKLPAGVKVTMGVDGTKKGKIVRKKVFYEITMVDKESKPLLFLSLLYREPISLFNNFLKGNTVSKSVLSDSYFKKKQPFDDKIKVNSDAYTLAFLSNNKAFNGSLSFESEIMARQFMKDQIRKDPKLKRQIHVIPQYEVQ